MSGFVSRGVALRSDGSDVVASAVFTALDISVSLKSYFNFSESINWKFFWPVAMVSVVFSQMILEHLTVSLISGVRSKQWSNLNSDFIVSLIYAITTSSAYPVTMLLRIVHAVIGYAVPFLLLAKLNAAPRLPSKG